MPTYRNDNTYTVSFKEGKAIPGQSIELEREITDTGFTKTSDLPYVKLSESSQILDFTDTEEQSITNLMGNNIIRLRNPSANFEVRIGSSDNDSV